MGGGHRRADHLPIGVGRATVQSDAESRGGRAPGGVEHVRRDAQETSSNSRSPAIFESSRRASASSKAGSLLIRRRSSDRISSPLRPLALMRKTYPNLSSYCRFSASSAARATEADCTARLCSRREL